MFLFLVDAFFNNRFQGEGEEQSNNRDVLKGAFRTFVVKPNHMNLSLVSDSDDEYKIDDELKDRLVAIVCMKVDNLRQSGGIRLIDFSTAIAVRSPSFSNQHETAQTTHKVPSPLMTFNVQFSLPPGSYATVFMEKLLSSVAE
jgi:tRNA(Glu) U13 pseudouridine synthase TruD